MQTDPIGYGDGMNMYAYCGNNAVGRTDPSGLATWYGFLNLGQQVKVGDEWTDANKLRFAQIEDGQIKWVESFNSLEEWYNWIKVNDDFDEDWKKEQIGYKLSQTLDNSEKDKDGNFVWDQNKYTKDWFFWKLQLVSWIGGLGGLIQQIEAEMGTINETTGQERTVTIKLNSVCRPEYGGSPNGYRGGTTDNFHIDWSPTHQGQGTDIPAFPSLAGFAHELSHAGYWASHTTFVDNQLLAIVAENNVRVGYNNKVPGSNIGIRPWWHLAALPK